MAVQVYTIGHSNHTWERFEELLRGAELRVVADVRSTPTSGYCPHFDREPLAANLKRTGYGYVFLGDALGGRPPEAYCYDAAGRVLYERIAGLPRFVEGLQRVLRGAERQRVALMCGEEDPAECHRHLLLARVLVERHGAEVLHVRGDGRVQPYAEIERGKVSPQLNLFEFEGPKPWTSARSVLPKKARESSSAP